MASFVLICSFAAFCGLEGCPEGRGAHSVKARLDPEAPIAEFWTSYLPQDEGVEAPGAPEPWPALLQISGFAGDEWVLFTAGAIQGQWMLSVRPDTGKALLSAQYFAFGPDVLGAAGQCDISPEGI